MEKKVTVTLTLAQALALQSLVRGAIATDERPPLVEVNAANKLDAAIESARAAR